MTKYKVIQEGPSSFYLYKKKWWGWECLNPYTWDHPDSFLTMEELNRAIERDKEYPKVFLM